jgi:molybdopterin molybdotransferase
MLTIEEALRIINKTVTPLETERLSLNTSLRRILAEDVFADMDMPPFNKSAMDGFACRQQDLGNILEIVGEIPAGSVSKISIGKNQCARIMTGAQVPDGADFVLMKEHAGEIEKGKIQRTKEVSRANICYVGEDVKAGKIILKKGERLLPAHIAMLASVGHINPLVYKIPSVAVLSTGNELVEPDEIPGISKTRNSNGVQLVSQSLLYGLHADYLGIVKDNEELLETTLSTAIEKHQVTLISGGVSVGDYDFVPKILKQLGVEIMFHGVKAKPGKHMLFGRKGNHFIFGMPGNPVSSYVQFEIMVKPLLNKLMGNADETNFLFCPLDADIKRKNTDEINFVPMVFMANGSALPIEYHGSAHIHAYTKAHGIMELHSGISELKKGEIVRVRPL